MSAVSTAFSQNLRKPLKRLLVFSAIPAPGQSRGVSKSTEDEGIGCVCSQERLPGLTHQKFLGNDSAEFLSTQI
jgi:hypothetical protein